MCKRNLDDLKPLFGTTFSLTQQQNLKLNMRNALQCHYYEKKVVSIEHFNKLDITHITSLSVGLRLRLVDVPRNIMSRVSTINDKLF